MNRLLQASGIALSLAMAAPPQAHAAAPPLTLDLRISRIDLDCLVSASNSLMDAGDPIIFSPDMCVGESQLDVLLSGTKRTSLPNRKASLPTRRSAAVSRPPERFVFSRKTLACVVKRSHDRALPAGDPVRIDLRTCP